MSKQAMELALGFMLKLPRQTKTVWKDGIDIEVPTTQTEMQDMTIAALKEAIKQQGEPVGYQRIFDAIAAATDDTQAGLAVSVCRFKKAIGGEIYTSAPTIPEGWTQREIELFDGMIEVQQHHADRCDSIQNITMGAKQKGWDMERISLLLKCKAMLAASPEYTGEKA
jgi:hypothetical protein